MKYLNKISARRSFLAASAFFIAFSSKPVFAQSYDEQVDRASYAGMYVSIPLGLVEKNSSKQDNIKFGFSAGIRQDQYGYRFDPTGRKTYESRLLDFQFQENRFQKLSLVGSDLISRNTRGSIVFLDGNNDEGMSLGTKILIGAGVAVLGTATVLYFELKKFD